MRNGIVGIVSKDASEGSTNDIENEINTIKRKKSILHSKCFDSPLSLLLILNEEDARVATNNAKKISSCGK
jgi:hypothetical protein